MRLDKHAIRTDSNLTAKRRQTTDPVCVHLIMPAGRVIHLRQAAALLVSSVGHPMSAISEGTWRNFDAREVKNDGFLRNRIRSFRRSLADVV
jgi:hypothetical protein